MDFISDNKISENLVNSFNAEMTLELSKKVIGSYLCDTTCWFKKLAVIKGHYNQ